mgnify:FL=1
MPREVNFLDIIKEMVEGNVEIVNNTICGKCSKCGECCSPFLPICQDELNIIQKYIIDNNIKPQTQVMVMQNRLACPYYDGKKCLIYEVRPLICKEFYCNKKMDMEMASKFQGKKYIHCLLYTSPRPRD